MVTFCVCGDVGSVIIGPEGLDSDTLGLPWSCELFKKCTGALYRVEFDTWSNIDSGEEGDADADNEVGNGQ